MTGSDPNRTWDWFRNGEKVVKSFCYPLTGCCQFDILRPWLVRDRMQSGNLVPDTSERGRGPEDVSSL
jgi:hypothetical protein